MKNQKHAFTMAEILLSLTIIGVVAAITLPSLLGNINERAWNTQRKALHARITQALSMMPQLNGYGTFEYATDATTGSTNVTADTAAMSFVTDGLSKVLKINNVCDNDKFSDCGIAPSFTNYANSTINTPKKLSELNELFVRSVNYGMLFQNPLHDIDTKAVAFETINGESILTFYNPMCQSGEEGYAQVFMCANFIYDLNGSKGPNQVGKDIGAITAFYPVEPNVVAPIPLPTNSGTATQDEAPNLCRNNENDIRLPNTDESSALFINCKLFNIPMSDADYYPAYPLPDKWRQDFRTGLRGGNNLPRTQRCNVRCIKR